MYSEREMEKLENDPADINAKGGNNHDDLCTVNQILQKSVRDQAATSQ